MPLLLVLGLALFIAFSGHERLARHILTSQLAQQGLVLRQLDTLRIPLDGVVQATGIELAGPIQAASHVIENLHATIDSVTLALRWSALWERRDEPAHGSPLADWAPPILSSVTLHGGVATITPVTGPPLRLQGLSLELDRLHNAELDARLHLERLEPALDNPTWQVDGTLLRASTIGPGFQLDELSGDTTWGRSVVHAQVDNVYDLVHAATTTAAEINAASQALSGPVLAAALAHLDQASAELSLHFNPPAVWPETPPLPPPVEAWQPPRVDAALSTGTDGFALQLDMGAGGIDTATGEVTWQPFEVAFADNQLVLEPLEVEVGHAMLHDTLPLRLAGRARLDREGTPFDVSANTPRWLNSDAVDAELPAKITGQASGSITLQGDAWPWHPHGGTAELLADLLVHVTDEAAPLAVQGGLLAGLQDQQLTLRSENLRVADGDVDVSAQGELAQDTPMLERVSGRVDLRALRLEPLLAALPPLPLTAAGAVTAGATFALEPERLETLSLDGDVQLALDDLVAATRSTGPLTLNASGRWRDGVLDVPALDLALLGGGIQGELRWDGPQGPPSGAADLALHFPSLRSLERLLPELATIPVDGALRGTLEGAARWSDPPEGEMHLRLESENVTWDGIPGADGMVVEAVVNPEGLRIEQAIFRMDDSHASLSGHVTPAGVFDAQADIELTDSLTRRIHEPWPDAPPWLSALRFSPQGGLSLHATATGSHQAPHIEVRGELPGATMEDVALEGLELALDATLEDGWATGGFHLELARLEAAGHGLRGLRLDGTLEDNAARAQLLVDHLLGGGMIAHATAARPGALELDLALHDVLPAQAAPLAGKLEGVLGLTLTAQTELPDANTPLTAQWWQELPSRARATLHAALDDTVVVGRPLGNLLLDGTLAQGVASADLRAATWPVSATATTQLADLSSELGATWTDLDLTPFLHEAGIDVVARNSGDLSASWRPGAEPQAVLTSHQTHIAAQDRVLRQTEPARFDVRDGMARTAGFHIVDASDSQTELLVHGATPLDASAAGVDLHLRMNALDLSPLRQAVEDINELEGQFHAQAHIAGSLGEPRITGEIRLEQGRLRVERFSQAINAIELVAIFEDDAMRLTQGSAHLGRGTLSATGAVMLAQPPRFDFHLGFDRIRYAEVEHLVVECDGALRLAGTPTNATLSGGIDVTRGSYTRPIDWTRAMMAPTQPRRVRRTAAPAFDPNLNVAVRIPGNFWVRNSMVSAELYANLRLVGSLSHPSLSGQANARRGVLHLPYGQFTLQRANALFDEGMPFMPYLVVEGETRQSGYWVGLILTGEPRALDFQWTSRPPLREDQIVNLLTSGSVDRLSDQDQSATALLVLSQGLRHSAAGGSTTRALPIDTIDLQPTRNGDDVGAELVVGQRITDRLSLRQYFDIQGGDLPSVGAEYQLTDRFLLSGRNNTRNAFLLEVIFELLF